MLRVTCVTAALMVAAAMSLPAQNRDRTNDFGRSDWCDDSRDRGGRATECRILEETVTDSRTVDVDAGRNGGIEVRGWDRDDVHVRARVIAWARSAARAREIVDGVRLSTAGGRIRAEGPASDEGWATSFELQVPRDARLTLNARNGGLSLSRFEGTADMRTINGGVSVDDARGDIQARTRNGGINVRLTGSRWDGRGLDIETTNGGVSVAVPDGYSAELETGTVNGRMRVDFPVTVQGTFDRRITATLGSGGARIRALTTNGGVTIARR